MSNVREILKVKGNASWAVDPQTTVKETLRIMADKNIGAVLIMEGRTIAGIFSERDLARHASRRDLKIDQERVKDLMTTRILFVSPAQTTEECMSLMTTKRIRHLPVIEHGELVGLISIGDVVNKIIEDQKFSISQLERYVSGGV